MQPTRSFWDNFSSEGRVKKLWAEALRETDPQKSLDLLRSVCEKLCGPPVFHHLWLPFLDVFLAGERVQNLNDADLAGVEKMGRSLQQRTDPSKEPSAFDVWQRVIRAYNARGEHILACNLAEKLYQERSSDEQTRVYALHELARQGMIEDRHTDMYIAYLRMHPDPLKEKEIFQVLDTLFAIDFSASDARLTSVSRVAQALLTLRIHTPPELVPHLQSAMGIFALLFKAAPVEARDYFERARQINSADRPASLGLLACEIRLGRNPEFTRLVQSSSFRDLLQDPDIAALLDLHTLIQWFDQPEVPGPLPLDANAVTHLATFPLHRYVGDIAIATLGRSYLLTGHAQLARAQFDLLMKKNLKLPQWGYYAAWAYALCDDGSAVADCFKKLASWPGRWTIACILLDLDQHLAEQSGATALLKNITATEAPAAPVVRSRLALAQTGVPLDSNQWTEAGYSLEEALEALRTGLAQALAQKDLETAAGLVTQSQFARLPLADQTFWLGLVKRDRARMLSLLEQTAGNWQYRRAALFLLVCFLRQGSWRQAAQYLEQALAGRTDLKAQLIRVYVEGREAHIDDAIQHGEQLAVLGAEKASYILGNLYFYQAAADPQQAQRARLQAALVWQRLLATEQVMLPADLPALAACASFIAYPQQRATSALALIQSFQELDVTLRQPWLEWHVALALLWYGTPQALIGLYPTMLNVAEMLGRAADATIAALARALARFARNLKDSTTTQQFVELLEHFAQQCKRLTGQRMLSSAIIMGQRSLYLCMDEHQRAQLEEDLRRRVARDPRNGLLILWQVRTLLKHNRGEATALLQTAQPDEPALAHLLRDLLNLLKGSYAEDTTLPVGELLTGLGRDALSAARSIASGHVQEGYNLLLRQHSGTVLAVWRVERILPPLCMYIQQKGITPPAFLITILHNWRPAAADGAMLVQLARCATILGDTEEACHLWEEALRNGTDDERHATWRQDFVLFLCRQAVSEYSADQGLEAASKLRRAARWTIPEFGQQLGRTRLLEYARTLELRAVTSLLLTYLFPDFDIVARSTGRYHALGLALARNPQLIEALVSRDGERIRQEWKKTLQAQRDNMRFLHTMSILYREVALSKQEQHIDTEKDWLPSTALWMLLLSTEAFWRYFAGERKTGAQDEQQQLSTRQREEIWQDAVDNIVVFHSTIARKSLAAGDYTEARIHTGCLALCQQRVPRLVAQLENIDLSFEMHIEQKRLEQIRAQAQKLFNEWGQSLLIEAEKSIGNVNSIKQLPAGIRKNYAGGIGVLEPFIRLDTPLTRVLLACLDWYNEWCGDLNLNGTRAQYRETAEAAGMVCEKLQHLCDKKNAYAAENKAIALHLLYRGLSLVNLEPERAIRFYEEAVAWGSDNPHLDEMLDRARIQSLEETALKYTNNQQFEEAYAAITQAGSLIKQQDAVRNLHMRISFRHARELVAQGRYTEALSRGKQASALEPTNTVLQQFIVEVEELIPEESYGQIFHQAEQALETLDLARALQLLARISPGSRLFKQAQDLRNQALQQQASASKDKATAAEEILDKETLAKREEHLRLVLEPGQVGENRAKAREELSIILAGRAADELQQANLLEKQPDLRHSRLIYARSLAEEAFELDPRNTLAKHSLEELKKLLTKKSEEKKA